MLRLVLLFLIVYLTPVICILADCPEKPPNVTVDGKTVKDTYNTSAALPLGTTLVLICAAGGISSNKSRTFNWTCPNGPCEEKEKGYFGRMITYNTYNTDNNKTIISESILAINITSTRDEGNYTCTVYPKGCTEGFKNFTLTVTGGKVVHSYGRLILHERVISDIQQLQAQNDTDSEGDGMIECRVSSGKTKFGYHGTKHDTEQVDHPKVPEINPTAIIQRKGLRPKKFAIEGGCASLYHYLFLEKDYYCRNLNDYVTITQSDDSITVTINATLPCGIARAIVGYATLVEPGVWVEVEYVNLRACESKTFSLAYHYEYRITAWGLSGGNTKDRRRCWSPTVRIDNVTSTLSASPPRAVQVTGMEFAATGMELNWIAPRDPNGYIMGYNVKCMKNGSEMRANTTINYYPLDNGQNYTNITVMAITGAGYGEESAMISRVEVP